MQDWFTSIQNQWQSNCWGTKYLPFYSSTLPPSLPFPLSLPLSLSFSLFLPSFPFILQREHELQELQGRRGSDQDSGVMCTADEKDAPHSPDSPFNTTSTYIHTTIMESPEHESTFVTNITTVSGANDTTISQDRGNEEEQIGGGYPSTDSGNDAQL